jgi:hypothetical protein
MASKAPPPRGIRYALERPDGGAAFLPDRFAGGPLLESDAESVAEEFIASATMGESVGEDARDEVVDEENGGPFLELEDAEPDTPEVVPEPLVMRLVSRR